MSAAKHPIPNKFVIAVIVKYQTGTYVARAHGVTASCTSGERQAVERLAAKLWGEGEHILNMQPSGAWMVWRDTSYADLVAAAAKMEEIVSGYLHDYEYEDGDGGCYSPNETEDTLINDAVNGLLADDTFLDALTDWRLLVRARKQEVPHAS